MQNLIDLFTQLAQIDSPSGEEKTVSDFVMRYLQALGLTPIQDDQHMVYCRIGNEPNPRLFCAHMDTVEPGRGIEVIQKKGYLQSKGNTILGGDNKVSVAAILHTVSKLIKQKAKLNIELLFSVREETNSGICEVNVSQIESKVGFVFDDGNGQLDLLVESAPTIQDFVIEFQGKSAHASAPEKGINAFEAALQLNKFITLGRPDEKTTLNIGLISGGTSTNTVPDRVTLKGDLRSSEEENFNYHKHILNIAVQKAADTIGAIGNVRWIPYAYGYTLDLNSANYKRLYELYKNSLDITLQPKTVKSGSDAGFLNHMGIETFCLGYGVQEAHTTEERIKIEDFHRFQKIVETVMVKF